jgi:ubiquinone/menaquinone biosynthesis C-methylase UbiE
MTTAVLAPAAAAFDAIAERFDERYGSWLSVAAQRRAVRENLARVFPAGSRLLEIGGGTGEDALWLSQRGRVVQLTDPSPSMIRIASQKLAGTGAPSPRVAMAESAGELASELGEFDGVYSNFAALNCVDDLTTAAVGIARLVRHGGSAMLVLFGTAPVGEWIVELLRGRPRAAIRRSSRANVSARIGGREFTVRYHRREQVIRAFAPYFTLVARRGIGVFVPPSAAEPWISSQPRLLGALERLDAVFAPSLAALGDHVLYELKRTDVASPEHAG